MNTEGGPEVIRPEACRGLCQKPHCGFTRPDSCSVWSWIECQRCERSTCAGCHKWECFLWMLELLTKSNSKKS